MTVSERQEALTDFFEGFRGQPLKILIASRSKIVSGKNQGDWCKFQFADYQALQSAYKINRDHNFILSTNDHWPRLLSERLINSTGQEFHMSFNHEIDGLSFIRTSRPNAPKFLFQLDDVTEDNLKRLISDFGKPFMTVNTSPGNYTVFCRADLGGCGRKFFDPLEPAQFLKPRVLFYQETIRNWFVESYGADKNGSGQAHFFRIPYIPRINEPVGFMPTHTKTKGAIGAQGLFLRDKISKLFFDILDKNDKLYAENENFEYFLNKHIELKPTKKVSLKNITTDMPDWFKPKFDKALKKVQKQTDSYTNQQVFIATKDVIRSVRDQGNSDLRDKYACWCVDLMQYNSSLTERDAEKAAKKALGQIEAEIDRKQKKKEIESPVNIDEDAFPGDWDFDFPE